MNKKIKNTTPKYVTLLLISAKQFTLFATTILATMSVSSLLIRMVPKTNTINIFQGNNVVYALLFTALVLLAIQWEISPKYIKTPSQIIKNGGRLINVIFGSILSIFFAYWLFMGIIGLSSTASITKASDIEITLLQLVITALAVRYFWESVLPKSKSKYKTLLAPLNYLNKIVQHP